MKKGGKTHTVYYVKYITKVFRTVNHRKFWIFLLYSCDCNVKTLKRSNKIMIVEQHSTLVGIKTIRCTDWSK